MIWASVRDRSIGGNSNSRRMVSRAFPRNGRSQRRGVGPGSNGGGPPGTGDVTGYVLARFRVEIVELFCQVVGICQQQGLIASDLLTIDSVKLRAIANYKQSKTLEGLEKEQDTQRTSAMWAPRSRRRRETNPVPCTEK